MPGNRNYVESPAAEQQPRGSSRSQTPAAPEATVQPTPGRVVLYTLSEDDAQLITHRRQTVHGLHGNFAQAGHTYPATVVRVWESNPNGACNLQVHLDGTDIHWATSRTEGTEPGTWAWPPRA